MDSDHDESNDGSGKNTVGTGNSGGYNFSAIPNHEQAWTIDERTKLLAVFACTVPFSTGVPRCDSAAGQHFYGQMHTGPMKIEREASAIERQLRREISCAGRPLVDRASVFHHIAAEVACTERPYGKFMGMCAEEMEVRSGNETAHSRKRKRKSQRGAHLRKRNAVFRLARRTVN